MIDNQSNSARPNAEPIEIQMGVVAEDTTQQIETPEKLNESLIVNKKLNIQTFDELAEEGKNLPDLKRLFGNHILEGNTVLFPSERGNGKTWLGLQIAMAIAGGAKEFVGEPIELNGNTLYLNMELGERVMKKRLAKLYENAPKIEGNIFKAYCVTVRRSLTEILEEIEALVKEYKIKLLAIDNLRTAFSDSDNERNKEMTKAIIRLNNLRDKYGFAVLLTHHTVKGTSTQLTNSDMQSGAGAITDLVDGDLFLRRSKKDSSLRVLIRKKSRNCEEQDGAKLIRLNPDTLWFEFVEENVDEREHIDFQDSKTIPDETKKIIFEKLAEGKKPPTIAKELEMDRVTVWRISKEKEG